MTKPKKVTKRRKGQSASKAIVRHITVNSDWKCECGKKHVVGVYAAAHWDEYLIHTCQGCHRQHSLQSGELTFLDLPNAGNKRPALAGPLD